jgi:hypothetical protein
MRRIINIDPESVKYYVGNNNVRFPFNKPNLDRIGSKIPALKFNRFIIPAHHYRTTVPLTELEKYKKVKDYLSKDHFSDSIWFNQMLLELRKSGKAVHKKISLHNEQELVQFFSVYVNNMINSLKKEGWDLNKGRPGTVTIGRNGELHKANAGDHRFFISRLLGIKPIPVKIKGIHSHYNGAELNIVDHIS